MAQKKQKTKKSNVNPSVAKDTPVMGNIPKPMNGFMYSTMPNPTKKDKK